MNKRRKILMFFCFIIISIIVVVNGKDIVAFAISNAVIDIEKGQKVNTNDFFDISNNGFDYEHSYQKYVVAYVNKDEELLTAYSAYRDIIIGETCDENVHRFTSPESSCGIFFNHISYLDRESEIKNVKKWSVEENLSIGDLDFCEKYKDYIWDTGFCQETRTGSGNQKNQILILKEIPDVLNYNVHSNKSSIKYGEDAEIKFSAENNRMPIMEIKIKFDKTNLNVKKVIPDENWSYEKIDSKTYNFMNEDGLDGVFDIATFIVTPEKKEESSLDMRMIELEYITTDGNVNFEEVSLDMKINTPNIVKDESIKYNPSTNSLAFVYFLPVLIVMISVVVVNYNRKIKKNIY